ncbi:HAMP domain-containing protein [Paenibacillus sp. MSJ-6]|uniref:histidine kinase n=1 Tax=Paenibacillus brevis TaxID=2841508 RepID=A0ABS6FXY7_9BACL|nr:HAMP domain-containing protein [Paenibacillus brevis]
MSLKRLISLRVKFLVSTIVSLLLSVTVMYLCHQLAAYILTLPNTTFWSPIREVVRGIIQQWGSIPAMIVAGTGIFILTYWMLTRGTIRYLKELDQALTEVGLGRMDVKIPLRTSDELGHLAQHLNATVEGLNVSIREITNGLGEIAEGNLERKIPAQAGELAKIADSINHMADRLNQSIEEERLAERSKNDLITGVSHDLRTPLTSILGFLEVIEEDRYKDETELRYYVDIAYEKAKDLKKLIDQLFEYTRIQNGLPLQKSELDLNGFLGQLAEEFVPILDNSAMQCRVSAQQDTAVIYADGDLLVRAFENLLSNAIQYGADGKFIDIEISIEEPWARVKFINYGKEIPSSSLPHLFDRFYRVDSSRSKTSGGTGLGLAIAKSIIDVHQGQVSVTSSPQSTAFEVLLPLATKR